MMEKLSAKEFDANFLAITENIKNAAKKSGRSADDIILLAATKTVDVDTINYAIGKGISYIGENKVQELLSKDDGVIGAHRHFIGHLQTNKVKDIISRVEMIESVDSLKLAKEISKQAEKCGKFMEILIEVNIGGEESKWGFVPENTLEAIEEITKLPNIKIKGLMAIPPVCENSEENRNYFRKMYKLFIDIRDKNIDNSSMDILSMGMSDDYKIAIEEGANLIRLGTALFGRRIYKI
ncbi:MAG: YggS family pyridoxal phosphate-dependent enzyme [Ruminococcaceae bacterium]|nr:YggS family pyridoxal phosphate-dependent enzyme [Oscillospiraceae bacterium]